MEVNCGLKYIVLNIATPRNFFETRSASPSASIHCTGTTTTVKYTVFFQSHPEVFILEQFLIVFNTNHLYGIRSHNLIFKSGIVNGIDHRYNQKCDQKDNCRSSKCICSDSLVTFSACQLRLSIQLSPILQNLKRPHRRSDAARFLILIIQRSMFRNLL